MQKSTEILPYEGSIELKEPIIQSPHPIANGVRTAAGSFEEDLTNALLVLFIPIVLIDVFFRAASRPLWFDEILTKLISSQPNVKGMWNLLSHGVTSHPPTFYLIEHFMAILGGNDRITYRLVSIASFLCVMACMFIFVRRRTGGLVAVISVSSLPLTLLYTYYAFEARPYAIMVACIALALLCYERVDSWGGALLFAVCLVAASSLNCYAGFAFFPFGLSELIRFVTERKFRPQVWLAFVLGVLTYFPFWPLLHVQQLIFGVHSFAAPTLFGLANSLGEVVHMDGIFASALFAATLTYLIYLAFSGEFHTRQKVASRSGFSLCDVVLTIGFLAIPIMTYIVAKIANGALNGRYVVTTSLGVCLVLSLILSRLGKPAILSVGLFVFCIFTFQEGMHVRYVMRPQAHIDFLESPAQMSENMDIPLVISYGIDFLPAWYRSSDARKSHLFFLSDAAEQFAASGSDTTTVQMQTLKYLPLMNVDAFSEFARDHRKFLLYSTGESQDFWPRWLLQRGYMLRAIDVDPPEVNAVTMVGGDPVKAILYYVDLDEHNKAI